MEVPVGLTPGEDGWIIAECPALPGCLTQGRSEAEALTNIREAIEGWLRVVGSNFIWPEKTVYVKGVDN